MNVHMRIAMHLMNRDASCSTSGVYSPTQAEMQAPHARRPPSGARGLFRNGDVVRVEGAVVQHMRTMRTVTLLGGAARGARDVRLTGLYGVAGELVDLRVNAEGGESIDAAFCECGAWGVMDRDGVCYAL